MLDTSPYSASAKVARWHRNDFDDSEDYAKDLGISILPLIVTAFVLMLTLLIWSCATCCGCKCAQGSHKFSGRRKVAAVIISIIATAAICVISFYLLENNRQQGDAIDNVVELVDYIQQWETNSLSYCTQATTASTDYQAALQVATDAYLCNSAGKTYSDSSGHCGESSSNIETSRNTALSQMTDFDTAISTTETAIKDIDLSGITGNYKNEMSNLNDVRESAMFWVTVALTILVMMQLMIVASNFWVRHKQSRMQVAPINEEAPVSHQGGLMGSDHAEEILAPPRSRSCCGQCLASSIIYIFMFVYILVWLVAILATAGAVANADLCYDADNNFLDLVDNDATITFYFTCDSDTTVTNPMASDLADVTAQFNAAEQNNIDFICAYSTGAASLCPSYSGSTANRCTDPTCIATGQTDEKMGELRDAFNALDAAVGVGSISNANLLGITKCDGLNSRYQAMLHTTCEDVFYPLSDFAILYICIGLTMLLVEINRRMVRPAKISNKKNSKVEESKRQSMRASRTTIDEKKHTVKDSAGRRKSKSKVIKATSPIPETLPNLADSRASIDEHPAVGF